MAKDGDVVADALTEVERCAEHGQHLLVDGTDIWSGGGLYDNSDELMEIVLVDGLVVHAVGVAWHRVGDAGTDFGGDDGSGSLFCPDDNLGELMFLLAASSASAQVVMTWTCGSALAAATELVVTLSTVAASVDLIAVSALGLCAPRLLRSSISVPCPDSVGLEVL